jgi:hypothetical protein
MVKTTARRPVTSVRPKKAKISTVKGGVVDLNKMTVPKLNEMLTQKGIDKKSITGTGKNGAVLKGDIIKALSEKSIVTPNVKPVSIAVIPPILLPPPPKVAPVPKDTFLNLVKKHFNNVKNFDVTKYIEKFHDGPTDDYGDVTKLDQVPITEILPGTVEIAIYDNFNICYHGRECTAESKRLYLYKKYVIVYSFDVEGDDTDVLDVPTDIMKVYKKLITVYDKSSFNLDNFVNEVNDINFIMTVFRGFYPKDNLEKFQTYITGRYNANLGSQQNYTIIL